ncbi:unnamed protein product [Calypogeia fissa]
MSLCTNCRLEVVPLPVGAAVPRDETADFTKVRRSNWRISVDPIICGGHHHHLSSRRSRVLRKKFEVSLGKTQLLARDGERWTFSLRASSDGEHTEEDTKKDETTSSTTETINDSEDAPIAEPTPTQEPNLSAEASPEEKVAIGSPLPGINPSSQPARIPKEDIDVLRDQVFGFDTFFVTGQEPYEEGVLFSGNLRGDASKSYAKLAMRLENKFGDKYKLFLLSNPSDDRPVSVIVPSKSLEPLPPAVPESLAAAAFGAVTVFTLLLRNAPQLQLAFLTNIGDWSLILDGLVGALPSLLVLLAHEAGHRYVAKEVGAKLAVPYFIPSWQLGSFGAITRITNILQSRKDLLKLAAAGPVAGAAVGLTIVLIGLLLPPAEGQGLAVNASAFHESFLVGGLAKLIMGDALAEGATVSINPIVLSAWAGLLINSINSIPVGELDGGRISQALWGRKAWSRLTGVSVGLLGVSGLVSDVPLYWVVLVLFLQRGPITPQSEEITVPSGSSVALGVGVLVLGLLVYFPFPFLFSEVLPPIG